MNSHKRAGQTIHHSKDGEEYVLDEDGNRQIPVQSKVTSKPGEFTTYDDSQGHCAFCGRLTCRGGCFK
jgi:hypothetical protein